MVSIKSLEILSSSSSVIIFLLSAEHAQSLQKWNSVLHFKFWITFNHSVKIKRVKSENQIYKSKVFSCNQALNAAHLFLF